MKCSQCGRTASRSDGPTCRYCGGRMVSAPTMPGTGGLFKSPFPSDATPANPPAPPAGQPGGTPGAGGDPRAQRPDLQVDWSHLERERAAIAANKNRREGAGQDPGARGGAPLIGANEVPQRERRDEREQRSARDQRGGGYAERDEYDDEGYSDQYDAYERRDERRGYGDARDRRRDEWDERDGRGGHAPARRYDDTDERDTRGGYDDRYDDGDDAGDYTGAGERYADRDDGRRPRYDETDESAAWAAPAQHRDPRWDGPHVAVSARGGNAAPREDVWQPGGNWGDPPRLGESGEFGVTGESAYFQALPPAAAAHASARPAKGGRAAKAGQKKRALGPLWLITSLLSAALVFVLVRAELQRSATPTTPNPTANSAQVFSDSLLTNKNGWLTNADCVFKSDGYHLTRGYLAYAPVADAINFDMTVRVTQKAGTVLAPYGLVFRRVSLGNYYVFGVDSNGKWTFYKALENVGSDIVSFTASPAIKQGLNAQNTLEVKAQGAHFTFFINGTQVGQADDTSLATKGALGVAGHDDIEVIFTAFSIKRLP